MGDVVRCPLCNAPCFCDDEYETVFRCKSVRFCGCVFTIEKKYYVEKLEKLNGGNEK